MLADAKLAGILVESVARQSRVHGATPYLYLVVGMGLNLSGSQALSAQLGRPVADLSNTGLKVDLVALVAALANAWQGTLQTLAQEGFTPFVDRLKPIDYLQGKRINVMQQEVVLKSGLAQGVTGQGALALRLDNGELESILVGDVSVRWQSTEEATNASGGP
jgi:biotin-(acetyl-CoA carboxylase) ligase